MGNRNSAQKPQLTGKLLELATKIFREIDVDDSKTIDKEETIKWWKNNFAAINSRAMFESVDTDNDGRIDFDEWLYFWAVVRQHGYTDEELEEELENIKEKGSWVQFSNCPHSHAHKND